jgi:hypothetical protein
MYIPIANRVRKLARIMLADNPDTDQYTYTNPSNDYPSDITYDVWPGEPSNKGNDPASKIDDLKKKYDMHLIGPGPIEDDEIHVGERPSFLEDPDSPKTDDQNKPQDFVKSKGEEDSDVLDRETWVGEGIIDPFSF